MTRSKELLLVALAIAAGGVVAAVVGDDEQRSRIAWVEDPAPDLSAAPPSAAKHADLEVEIREVPDTKVEGTVLEFVARLSNPTDQDIRLDPCPHFRMVVGESATLAEHEGSLPCDLAPVVPAGDHIDFEMQILLEAEFGMTGENGVLWQLWGPGSFPQDTASLTIT